MWNQKLVQWSVFKLLQFKFFYKLAFVVLRIAKRWTLRDTKRNASSLSAERRSQPYFAAYWVRKRDDSHKKYLCLLSYLETDGQWVVLHKQFDVVAGSQQLHYSFLMRSRGYVVSVHLQYPIAHAQFAGVGCNAAGNDLFTIIREQRELLMLFCWTFVCLLNTYMRDKDAGLVGAEWNARVISAADDAKAQWSLVLGQHHFLKWAKQKK